MARPFLVVIAGPTASGKSAAALRLAERTPVTVVNADSMQVYRDLEVVTARPNAAEEAAVPHRLFGDRDGAEPCSAAAWSAAAAAAIGEAVAAGRTPVLVGGTGLYLRTLLDGIAPVPPVDPAVRDGVRALPLAAVHTALAVQDPDAARRLALADGQRRRRALEVVRATGRPLADWQRARAGGLADAFTLVPIVLAPDRAVLAARIEARFARILVEGQAEVAALLARGLDPALPVMRAIGVGEIAALLGGTATPAEAQAAGAAATRRYAKRQRTWFAHQTPDWPTAPDAEEAVARIEGLLRCGKAG